MKGEESKVSISPSACPRSESGAKSATTSQTRSSRPVSVYRCSQLQDHSYRSENHSKSRQRSGRRYVPTRSPVSPDRGAVVCTRQWDNRTTRRKESSANLGKRVSNVGWGQGDPDWSGVLADISQQSENLREANSGRPRMYFTKHLNTNRPGFSRIASRMCGEGRPCEHRIQESTLTPMK